MAKSVEFTMDVDLSELLNGLEALNDMADGQATSIYGDDFVLSDIAYRPVSVLQDGLIQIRVNGVLLTYEEAN